jgi:two-component system chemotaxis sensor kinase CheA
MVFESRSRRAGECVVNGGADAELMSQFKVEVDQHLAAVEPALGAAEPETLTRSDIDLLFREFHSIKGLARVVAATGMEALAHEAENLLSPVRSGDRAFDASLQEPLTAAADALRDALAEPLGWQAPSAIIAALRAATAAIAANSTDDGGAGSADNEPWRFLGDDLDLLRAFAELLDEVVPQAAQAMVDRDEDGLVDAIDGIVFACTRLGFDGLKAAAQDVAERAGAERLCAFATLARKIMRFGALVSADCGVTDAVVLLHDALRALLMKCLDEALASPPAARRPLIRRCLLLCDVSNLDAGAAALIEGVVSDLPSSVSPAQDRDALLVEGLAALRRSLRGERDAAVSVAALRDAICAPFRAGEEIEAHLRRLGLDTKLFSPGPPRRLERLATLLDGSGATLKEVFIEAVTPAALAGLTPLDPLLGQSAMRGGRSGIAVLLLDAEQPDADAAPHGVGELRRLDPGHTASEFSLPSGSAVAGAEPAGDTQVRIPVAVLDKLFGRVGEFFSIGSQLNVLATETDVPDALRRLSDFAVTRAPQLQSDIEILARQHRDFSTVEADVGRILSLIHESTLGLRVIPLEMLTGRFPRMVRNTARARGKQVRLVTETGGIRVDKGMSDMLADPLTHMLTNAIDHGIEPEAERLAQGKPRTATLRLSAQQQGNRIVMEISDDGRGIDIERVKRRALSSRLASEDEIRRMTDEQLVRLIFTPGFSTKEEVTDVSGRGVGMDVVLVHVTKLGGKIDITTQPGVGTTFRLDLPLSAAIQPMLLADTGVQSIGFPEAMVSESLMFPSDGVQFVNGQRAILLRERFLPVFKLTELLRLPSAAAAAANGGYLSIVLCQWAGQRMGIEVHRILRRGEMLIREAHPRVAALPGIGGITSMGFDRIVLVLDPEGMFELARKASVTGLQVPAARLALEHARLALEQESPA